jgi:solute carrier family 25 citrate transporter 1
MAGLGAGVFEAILVVTPAETLKVKLIHDRLSETPKYHGLFHGISSIVKTEGFSGIYKGLVPTILKQGSN